MVVLKLLITDGYYLVLRSVTPHDFPQLETLVKKIVNEKQPFERLEMKKEDLLKMFEVCWLFVFVAAFCGVMNLSCLTKYC